MPYVIYFAAYFGWAYLVLAHSAHTYAGKDPVIRIQTNYVLFGTALSTIIGAPPNLILPMFGIFFLNWLGQVVIIVMALAITYAIFKHNLLNIKVIAAEIFAGLVGLIFIIQVFLSQNALELLARLAILLVVGVFVYFLVKSVLQEIRSREEIERLNRTMSEFLAIASHQIRSPLTHIKSALAVIREGDYGPIDARTMPILNGVYISTDRLIRLVNDLLDMSRMESGQIQYVFTEFDFVGLVDSVIAEFKIPSAEKGVTIVWRKNTVPLLVQGDEEKIRQVVFNLVDNALKYTPKGAIEVRVAEAKGNVALSVKDSGMGMSDETIDRLFKKFSRGSVKTGGTGLGLYVAKRIIDDHKGKLWAESEGEGKGSVFHLELATKNAEQGIRDSSEEKPHLAKAA